MQNAEYFTMHLYNKIQDKYGLEDHELEELVKFVENIYDGDKMSGVRLFLKNHNDSQMKRMISQVINRDLDTQMNSSFAYNADHLAIPVGFPLTM